MLWVRVPPEADERVRKYSNAGYSSMGGALSCSATPRQTELNEDWYTERDRGKIERGRGKITGRKKKIQLHLWDSNPQPLAYMDKGTTTCAKPEVVGRGSGSYPVEEHC